MRISELSENTTPTILDWIVSTDAAFGGNSVKRVTYDTLKNTLAADAAIYYTDGDLATAVTAHGSTACTIVVNADETISANLDISSMTADLVFTYGNILTIATGCTLTMKIPQCLSFQIFSCAGTGKVVFSAVTGVIKSAWFGLTPTALQLALDSAPEGAIIRMCKASSAYSISTAIDIDANDNLTIGFEPGFAVTMVADVDTFSITKDNIRLYGNNAYFIGTGTFKVDGIGGYSFFRSTGDYTHIEGFDLEDCHNVFIRVSGDYPTVRKNIITGGPLEAAVGGNRSYYGVFLSGALVADADPYGCEHALVEENFFFKNSSGGKQIESIFANHITHPSMFAVIRNNRLNESAHDHGIYMIAEGAQIYGNILYKANGIKVQMRPSGTAEYGNLITKNIGNNTGMGSAVLHGDAFITLGNCEWSTISENKGYNFQNGGIQVSGTDNPWAFKYNDIIDNLIDGVECTTSTFIGGFVVHDSNLTTFAYNKVNGNTFKNIGTDATATPGGIVIKTIKDVTTHVWNEFCDNTIDTTQYFGIYLNSLTYGKANGNIITGVGATTPEPAIRSSDVWDFEFDRNQALGTGSQQTYGYSEADSGRNRVTNSLFKACATGMAEMQDTSKFENNSDGNVNGSYLAYSTAGDRTLSASEMLIRYHDRNPNNGGSDVTDTTPAATAMIALFLPHIGCSHTITYRNTSATTEDITIAGGSGVTIYNNEGASDGKIPANCSADLKIVRVASATVRIYMTVFEAV